MLVKNLFIQKNSPKTKCSIIFTFDVFLYYSSNQFSVVAYCDLFNQFLINNNNNRS